VDLKNFSMNRHFCLGKVELAAFFSDYTNEPQIPLFSSETRKLLVAIDR
jgi:hypothetical protein